MRLQIIGTKQRLITIWQHSKRREAQNVNDYYENYEKLAYTIVKQAVRDYRCSTEKNKKVIEKFFCSDWFKVLTGVNGEFLVDRLRKEGKNKNGKSSCNS